MKNRRVPLTEHNLQTAIRQQLGSKYKIFRTNVGKVLMADGRYFDTGLPRGHSDLYGYRPDGQIFYIEVKVRPNRPSPEQVEFIEAARAAGALAGVAYSVVDAWRIAQGGDPDA